MSLITNVVKIKKINGIIEPLVVKTNKSKFRIGNLPRGYKVEINGVIISKSTNEEFEFTKQEKGSLLDISEKETLIRVINTNFGRMETSFYAGRKSELLPFSSKATGEYDYSIQIQLEISSAEYALIKLINEYPNGVDVETLEKAVHKKLNEYRGEVFAVMADVDRTPTREQKISIKRVINKIVEQYGLQCGDLITVLRNPTEETEKKEIELNGKVYNNELYALEREKRKDAERAKDKERDFEIKKERVTKFRGRPGSIICPKCQAHNKKGSNYCFVCGEKINKGEK